MSTPQPIGIPERPLRVGVVGAGPSGFYVVEALTKQKDRTIAVDLIDRLPAPYGLVRYGVAPDHQNIKAVTKVYEKLAQLPGVRFFGNVDYPGDVDLDALRACYDQIVFCVGADRDRPLGVAGEDGHGSYSATEFVAWYNGHPDYQDRRFLLDCERAVVVGVGNVAMDVTRVLVAGRERLGSSDITEQALQALERAAVREVVLLARRGAAQAAFSPKEIEEIGELPDVDLIVDPADVAMSDAAIEALDREARKNVLYLRQKAAAGPRGHARRVVLKFLASPQAIAIRDGRVASMSIERNELVTDAHGVVNARGTGLCETIDTGLVFRSIGYRGRPLAGLPFDDRRGVIPHVAGHVVHGHAGERVADLFVAGWIKRGPTGLIGTNKADAAETVATMLAQAPGAGPSQQQDLAALLKARHHRYTTFADWLALDALERERGAARGKVRDKFVSVAAMFQALQRP